jgi:hypothetical protein
LKIAAYILVCIVGLLTLQPIFGSRQAMTETKCCSKNICHKSKKQDKKSEDCGTNGCNPFMACSMGNFYFSEKPLSFFVIPTSVKQKFVVSNDNRLSEIIYDFWQPPETCYTFTENLFKNLIKIK